MGEFEAGCFIFVDIHGRQVHALCPATSKVRSWRSPERIGWLIETTSDGEFIAGMQSGFARVCLAEAEVVVIDWVARIFAENPQLRLNDAKADGAGRIWAGSLNNDDETADDGKLFRLAVPQKHAIGGVGAEAAVVDTSYKVANGPAIHPDGSWMLHSDSARRTIYRFDLDMPAGKLSNRRVWKILDASEGYPDGMTFDAHGFVWVAHWGAGMVSQYDAQGLLIQRGRLPVSNVTNLAFGGAGLERLLVTTARAGLSDESLAREPLAGSVFELTGHGSRGIETLRCRV
jgi:sugar lactone lactonase YvrE